MVGYPRWFITVVAHGVEGLIAGFSGGRNIVVQTVLCAVGGLFMTLTYFYVNIFIKGYPVVQQYHCIRMYLAKLDYH